MVDNDININGGVRGTTNILEKLFSSFGLTSTTDYILNKAASDAANRKAQEDAIKAAQTKADTITQYPFISGAKNKSALGNTIPYLLGKMYNTPYKLSDGFYTLSGDYGEKQYYHCVMSLGFGRQNITEVLLGQDSLVKNSQGLESKEYNFPIGLHDKKNESGKYNNTLEIRQNGEDFENDKYNYKVVVTNDGSEIKHDHEDESAEGEYLVKQVADYTQRLEVCIQFPALRQLIGNVYEKRKAIIRPYWSNDDGVTWNEFYFDGMTDNTIELNVNHTVRFIATKEFSASETYGKKIKLKVAKITPKAESGTDENCYLAYYQSFCYDNKLSSSTQLVRCKNISDELKNKTTRLGITIIANENTNNLLEEIHTISQAYARTWNGSSWSAEKVPTSNPAAQILEVRTSDIHLFSKYTNEEINLNSLGALYKYCDDNNFEVNALLTSGIKKADLIKKILDCCNAVEFMDSNTGKLTYAIDKPNSNPVGIINAENVTNLVVNKDLSRKPDGLKVMYTSSNSWQIDTFFAMMNGGEKGINDAVTDYNLDFVTDYNHAYKLAQRKIRQTALQMRVFSASMGLEARKYKIFDTIHLQHPSFRIGLVSSTIVNINYSDNGNISGFELSDYITFESGKRYGIIINAVSSFGSRLIKSEITGTGKTRSVNLTEEISGDILPQLFNLCSIGELTTEGAFTRVSDVMLITNIEPNSNGFDIELKDYNPAIYESGVIPPYRSNITRPPMPSLEIPNPSEKGLNGDSGYNTRTVTLYIRSESEPQDLPFTFTQEFSHAELDATLQQLNGWSIYLPEIRQDNAPIWSITQTKVSQLSSTVFYNDKWSKPIKVSQDVEITKQELQDMLNELVETAAPSVYATRYVASVAVDINNRVTVPQTFETTIHVLQAGEDIDFTFEEITLPQGWSASHIGNVLKLTVEKGAIVTSDNFIIKIKYRPYISFTNYADELDEIYIDELGISYGTNILANEETFYSIGFGITQIKGGRYLNNELGLINELNKIPSADNLIIGDYFTWSGENAITQIVEDTKLLKSAVYFWNGTKWQKTGDPRYLMPALSDVLTDANEELEANNSEAVALFKRIVSHEVIAENLTTTGTAFMNKVIAKTVASNTFIAYGEDLDNKAKTYAANAQTTAISTASTDATTKANAAQNAAIEAAALDSASKAQTAESNAKTAAQEYASTAETNAKGYADTKKSEAINSAAEDATTKAATAKTDAIKQTLIDLGFTENDDVTIIDGGKILTKFIKTNEIVIGDLSGYQELQNDIDSKTTEDEAKNATLEELGVNSLTNHTIIENGKIKTGLIDADDIFTRNLTLKQGGVIKSENFLDADGNETGNGFKLDGETGNLIANNGIFKGVFGVVTEVLKINNEQVGVFNFRIPIPDENGIYQLKLFLYRRSQIYTDITNSYEIIADLSLNKTTNSKLSPYIISTVIQTNGFIYNDNLGVKEITEEKENPVYKTSDTIPEFSFIKESFGTITIYASVLKLY